MSITMSVSSDSPKGIVLDHYHDATLDGVKLKDFQRALDEALSSFLAVAMSYGSGGTLYEQARREDTVAHGAFEYIYRDNETGGVVAKIGARRYRKGKIEVFVFWDERATGLAKLLVTCLRFDFNVPFPQWFKSENYREAKVIHSEQMPPTAQLRMENLTRGKPTNELYDGAFTAIYIDKEYSNRRKAFNAIVLPFLDNVCDATQEQAAFVAFESAMNRRLRKQKNIE